MEPTSTSLVLTLAFQDSTSRKYVFSGYIGNDVQTIRSKVKAINANMPADFSSTFISDDGSPCVMIASVNLVTVQEDVIYSAN